MRLVPFPSINFCQTQVRHRKRKSSVLGEKVRFSLRTPKVIMSVLATAKPMEGDNETTTKTLEEQNGTRCLY